jgi:hypothetical protein
MEGADEGVDSCLTDDQMREDVPPHGIVGLLN